MPPLAVAAQASPVVDAFLQSREAARSLARPERPRVESDVNQP
jgi:hypothetical protein